jgi:ubiquinone/menaquinone biosynthesis C-methylase UbiE
MSTSTVVATYSENADWYASKRNSGSCWGIDTDRIIRSLDPRPSDKVIVDVGCGDGLAFLDLAARMPSDCRLIGVEPAANLRDLARETTKEFDNVEYLEGAFESIPLASKSVDYMSSINAFHWCPKPEQGVQEIRRVLKDEGAMDHFFIGRNIGREFIRATTPIFLKYMGPKRLLEVATMRQQLTVEAARALFQQAFSASEIEVTEEYTTYYDTVEGHRGWWVRIEPQLLAIPSEKREQCDAEIRKALAKLDEGKGVPYTMHTIHVRKR